MEHRGARRHTTELDGAQQSFVELDSDGCTDATSINHWIKRRHRSSADFSFFMNGLTLERIKLSSLTKRKRYEVENLRVFLSVIQLLFYLFIA